jgi:hypothetical protein
MIFRVRTRSGREYLTESAEPFEAMRARPASWTTITFTRTGTGNVVTMRGDALESVEVIQDTTVQAEAGETGQ